MFVSSKAKASFSEEVRGVVLLTQLCEIIEDVYSYLLKPPPDGIRDAVWARGRVVGFLNGAAKVILCYFAAVLQGTFQSCVNSSF